MKQKCRGRYTRINMANPSEKSVIDYVICSDKIVPNIIEMEIDEAEKTFRPQYN